MSTSLAGNCTGLPCVFTILLMESINRLVYISVISDGTMLAIVAE